MAVDRGVTSAVDDAAAVRTDLEPVAMAPDVGVGVKVARQIALIARVAPKVERHAGNRLAAHQLTHLVYHRLPLFVPRLHRTAQCAALHGTGRLRQLAVAANKGTGKVGATGNIAPPDVFLGIRGGHAGKLLRPPGLRVRAQR